MIDAKTLLHSSGGMLGMNVYRGCTHGCVYCDSRSRCYGFSHAFEDVAVKRNAPALLDRALAARRKACVVGTGSMSDPYQPVERELGLTRRCLEVLLRRGFGAALLTKSDLVLRDLELLEAIQRRSKCVVQMTLTTWDSSLCRTLEPGVCDTQRRVEVLAELRRRGIPSYVWLSPILPFLNDDERNVNAIVDACLQTGVRGIVCFGMGLTLREGSREHFYAALDRHFPGLRERYETRYGSAYVVSSPHNARLMRLLQERCERYGLLCRPEDCFRQIASFPQDFEQTALPL